MEIIDQAKPGHLKEFGLHHKRTKKSKAQAVKSVKGTLALRELKVVLGWKTGK